MIRRLLAQAGYTAARPLLFRMDGERAHDLTLAAINLLAIGGARPVRRHASQHMGLSFPNPVGLAAGLDKNAKHVAAFAGLGFGHIEIGTVTPEPQPGNSKPRMFRVAEKHAIINRMGFNGDGVEVVGKRLEKLRPAQRPAVLGVNLGKNKATPNDKSLDDYRAGFERLSPLGDYVTINISSPNTQGLRDLQAEDALNWLLDGIATMRDRAAKRTVRKPLVLKVAPDLSQNEIETIAKAVERHGFDGLIATNTTVDHHAVSHLVDEAGGLSGAPLAQSATGVLRAFRTLLPDVCLIGSGGVMDAATVGAKRQAGADLVQLYTGLIYSGPGLIKTACKHWQ